MRVRVIVRLKDGVLDPQGKAVLNSLRTLGFGNVEDVRVGKVIDLDMRDVDDVGRLVDEMCSKLLVNPVIETYEWYVLEG